MTFNLLLKADQFEEKNADIDYLQEYLVIRNKVVAKILEVDSRSLNLKLNFQKSLKSYCYTALFYVQKFEL